jgi:hypothetical protein
MGNHSNVLPGTGRWQSAGLTEGAFLSAGATSEESRAPSTTSLWLAVPLPGPGRI